MSYKQYLETKIKHPTGLEDYQNYQVYFINWLATENLTVATCQYVDLLSYVKKLKSREISTHTLNSYIRAVRYYYEYLQTENQITHNPARRLYIKGTTTQLPSDLLSKKELNTIYVNYPTTTIAQKRNKTLLGLVIYQGLRLAELEAIEPREIDLHQGTVYIKKTGRSVRRTLKLEAHQILPLQDYITETLPKLRAKAEVNNDKLLMSLGKSPGIKELVCDLNKSLRKQYPRYKNLVHVRCSVISHWIEEKNIIEVQYMAGHNSVTSTERYKRANMHDLKKSLDQYHPLR